LIGGSADVPVRIEQEARSSVNVKKIANRERSAMDSGRRIRFFLATVFVSLPKRTLHVFANWGEGKVFSRSALIADGTSALPGLLALEQIHRLQSEADVAFDFGRLKSLARAIDEKLVAAGVNAGAGIALEEREHAVVESLPNCQFVLTTQDVLL